MSLIDWILSGDCPPWELEGVPDIVISVLPGIFTLKVLAPLAKVPEDWTNVANIILPIDGLFPKTPLPNKILWELSLVSYKVNSRVVIYSS